MQSLGKKTCRPPHFKATISKRICGYILFATVAFCTLIDGANAGGNVQFSGHVTKDIRLFINVENEIAANVYRGGLIPIKVGKTSAEQAEVYIEIRSLNGAAQYRSPPTQLRNFEKSIKIDVSKKTGSSMQESSSYRVCVVPTQPILKKQAKCRSVRIKWNFLRNRLLNSVN